MQGCDAACAIGVKKAIVRRVGLRTRTASGSKQTMAASWNAASSGSASAAATGANAAALSSATPDGEQPAAPVCAGRCPPAGACSPTPDPNLFELSTRARMQYAWRAPTCVPPSLGSAVPAAAPARPWDTLPKGLAGGVPHPRPPAVAAAASSALSTSSLLAALASELLEARVSTLPCSIPRCGSAGAAWAPGAACGLLAAGVVEVPDSVRGSPAQHICRTPSRPRMPAQIRAFAPRSFRRSGPATCTPSAPVVSVRPLIGSGVGTDLMFKACRRQARLPHEVLRPGCRSSRCTALHCWA